MQSCENVILAHTYSHTSTIYTGKQAKECECTKQLTQTHEKVDNIA